MTPREVLSKFNRDTDAAFTDQAADSLADMQIEALAAAGFASVLVEPLKQATELLAFHEGSEELKLGDSGEPVIWINANGPDGDFQTILRLLRAAQEQNR